MIKFNKDLIKSLGEAAEDAEGRAGQGAMSRTDVWYMVSRRAANAGIETR